MHALNALYFYTLDKSDSQMHKYNKSANTNNDNETFMFTFLFIFGKYPVN